MVDFSDQWRAIRINGELRMATKSRLHGKGDFDGTFFVDSADMPRTRTSAHRLSPGATAHMERGGCIKSSGNIYSL